MHLLTEAETQKRPEQPVHFLNQLLGYFATNKIARNDKKYVHPSKATRDAAEPCMIKKITPSTDIPRRPSISVR